MNKGLSSNEAALRLIKFGSNILPQHKPRSSFRIIISIFKEPMIALLIAGTVVYFIIGDIKEALLLFFMIGIVSLITYYQEKKTENALQKLKSLSSPRVKVLRDGQEKIIPGTSIVPGDVIKLVEGDRVPADCTLLSINNLTLDESTVTGESLPVIKSEKDNTIFSGTLVSSGWAFAVVDKTGSLSVVGQIGKNIESIEDQPTRIQKETNRIVLIFASIGLVVCFLVILLIGIQTQNWIQAILSGIAVAMSILPEEFPVVLTIFMALGALKISLHKVLARNLPTIETLGSATVLCVDKTGTLTQNKMELSHLVTKDRIISINEYPFDGECAQIIEYARLACQQEISDPMEKAIEALSHSKKLNNVNNRKLLFHFPFDTELRVIANAYRDSETRTEIYLKGAPETVTSFCNLDPKTQSQIHNHITEVAKDGVRLIAVAKCQSSAHFRQDLPISHYVYEFIGLIGFTDPLRPEAKHAIEQCQKAGIRVIMITGDHKETARYIGQSLGLVDPERILTGGDIEKLSSKELRHQLAVTHICARIMPEQKLMIVKALKQNGDIVAMTGDGVNDAPALKAADMGISMGLRGTDVAREASDIVLLDDNFASIVRAINEGRRIFDNIRKAVSFIIAVHVPIAFLAIAPLILGWPTILSPIHIIILELIIDPASTLVFESEPADDDVMTRPPRSTKEKLFSKPILIKSFILGTIVSISVLLSYLISYRLGFHTDQIRTMAFVTLIIGNTVLIVTSRAKMFAPNHALLWIMTGVAIFIFLILNRGFFTLSHLGIVLSLGVCTLILSELTKRILVTYNNRHEY